MTTPKLPELDARLSQDAVSGGVALGSGGAEASLASLRANADPAAARPPEGTLRRRWFSLKRQLQALSIIVFASLCGAAALVALDRRQSAEPAGYVSAAAEVQTLSKRIAAAAKTLRETGAAEDAAVRAADEISRAAEALLQQSAQLAVGYGAGADANNRLILAAALLGALALVCLAVIGKLIVRDAEGKALESQRRIERTALAHQRTQDAILRLLDDMEKLAQGDLTVRANVTDEVTGTVADSINYAVDELCHLVEGINTATTQLAGAATEAQVITGELLNAAQRQSQEITETNAAVGAVAASVVQVSQRAAESAQVAAQSLAAAVRGSDAVRRAIQGMDGIREQIQDTAKRIKRLGESSQEIGEIVDLISDITEQTNVLALNAAIQATSAGPAGRGFSMVAEEVQRLAERSARATRQISAIVKTIQTDTQDATSAMERSTQGVVEQTGLADAAGKALARIDEVSRQLATLIGAISASTREQTASADRIRANMMDILRITELTTEGTRKTADSTARLAQLALELKQSVADFKLP